MYFVINMGRSHWIVVCAYMQEWHMEQYDSLIAAGVGTTRTVPAGDNTSRYMRYLFQYLKKEHLAKKQRELPYCSKWRFRVVPRDDLPQQNDSCNCGVFACMFTYFLSLGLPLSFGPEHMGPCRLRIALSLLNGRLMMTSEDDYSLVGITDDSDQFDADSDGEADAL